MKSKINTVKRHIIIFTVICCFIILYQVLDIHCPIKYFTGIPCPTCGVTRAMMALFRVDIDGYLVYHPLALPLVISVLAMLHAKYMRHKLPIFLFTGITLTLNLILYAVRLLAIH